MKTISYKLKDLDQKEKKVTLKLGYVGENEHVQIRIDCSEIWENYPNAVASLAVEPPEGSKYPAIVTREGNIVCWTVKDSDLVHDGDGRIQLTFTDGSEIQKTVICRTKVDESIIGSGTAPDPIADFVAEANQALAELEAAEVHGPVIGEDGYWYTWSKDAGEYVKTDTKAQGEDGQQGPAGKDGKDGADGAPGQDGHTPVKGTDYWTQQDQADIVAAAALETVSAVIDDTAGSGDTNKVWSADKSADVAGRLTNAIQGKPETKATDATNVDLDITDNSGNVVARFKDGHFQTKNFNSSAVISAIESLENAAAGSDYLIPSYWVDTLAAKEQTINGINNGIGANGVTFLFFTDYHQNSNNGNSLPLMLHILKNTSVSDVFYGGDTSDGGSLADTAAAEAKLREVANHLKPLNMFAIRGNHDCEPSATVTTNQVPESSYYDMYVRPIENKIKGTGKPYYYIDNDTAKVRYICMDSGSRLTNALDSTQITWLKAKLTELTSGWTVVIFQHMVYEKVNTEEQTLITMGQDLLDAIDDVFSNLNCEIACVIAGHCHTDAIISTTHNFKVITTTCDSGGINAAGDPLYPTRTPGTTLEQAFDVFSIDTVNKTINMTRIGAGVDRDTTY